MTIKVAPGFMDLIEMEKMRVTELGWNKVTEAIEVSAQLHTEAMDELLSAVVENVEQVKEKVEIPAATELQPLEGEFDRPKPTGYLYSYEQGYPLFDAGHAWGTGRKTSAKMTIAEANKLTLQGLEADSRWMVNHILNPIFYPTSWVFVDKKWGNLTIQPLANGDSQEYVLVDGTTAADNHYLAQAAAIDNSNNPFPTIYTELTEHPENMGDPVVYVPTGLKTSIEALSGFVKNENPAIAPGTATDTLNYLPSIPFGDKVLGMVDDCWIVEWRRLPAGYMLALIGDEPFIGWRQEPEPELRGLYPEFYVENGIQRIAALIRTSGFSVRRRAAALVCQIGSASYSAPAAFASAVRAVG